MDRVRKLGVPAPGVYLVDLTERKIYLEYLQDAITVKQFLLEVPFTHKGKWLIDSTACLQLAEMIATNLSIMHLGDTIHGDLTTSNMMLKPRH